MAFSWKPEQISALAPDAKSLKAAEGLAVEGRWVTLGQETETIWGECRGSGSKPYQTAVALDEPAFRCSCPSRKFPCKHALALFLLFGRQPTLLPEAEPPDWVATWREKRTARESKAAVKKGRPAADPQAQAKRVAKREQKIEEGLAELEQWLQDLIRQGLASAQGRPFQFWDGMAARLVDAQAPGLARLVRQLAGIPATGNGWPERLLRRLALLHLLIQSYRNLDALPPERQADVRTAVGWTIKQEELLAQSGVQDRWQVLGRRIEEEEGLRTQRTWLLGEQTNQLALILDFAYRNQPLDTALVPGMQLEAELVFYPGTVPLRAICKTRPEGVQPIANLPNPKSMTDAISHFNHMAALTPWLESVAFPLSGVVPIVDHANWHFCDQEQNRLPIAPSFQQGWELLALSGGHPLTVVAEWDGACWLPLSAEANERLVTFP